MAQPLQVGEIEELLRLIIQSIDKYIQRLLEILEQIVVALIETLPGQD